MLPATDRLPVEPRQRSAVASGVADLSAAFLVTVAMAVIAWRFFGPVWETNDDAAMSMIANGQGLIAEASPQLIFSNVLWGYLVAAVTSWVGTYGYYLCGCACVVLSGSVIYFGLRRSSLSHVACVAAMIALLWRPFLIPQFTLNAGLAMLAALCLFKVYSLERRVWQVGGGCLLFLCSFLIRSQEALLVCILGAPFLLGASKSFDKRLWIGVTLTVCFVAISMVFDYLSLHQPAWAAFNELNLARAPYTDFGVGKVLANRPDILQRHGVSANDAALISGWGLYAVPQLATPALLNTLLGEMGLQHISHFALPHMKQAVAALARPYLLPSLVAAVLLTLLSRSWRTAAICWSLFFVIIVLLGVLGRPAILRVYYPMLSLLMLMPLMHEARTALRGAMTIVLVGAATAAAFTVSADHARVVQLEKSDFRDLAQLHGRPLYVWGAEFPFERAYPPTRRPVEDYNIRLYGFGVFTPAPISVASREVAVGRPFVAALASVDGAALMATSENLSILSLYCQEHEHGALDIRETGMIAGKPLWQVRCRQDG